MGKQVNVARLLTFFEERQCHHTVRFIQFLASPEAVGLLEIGSGTMDLDGAMENPNLSENDGLHALMFKTHSVYVGSRDGSVTPLEWMDMLTEAFDKIDSKRRERLDKAFGEMVDMHNAPVVGEVVITDQYGVRRMSAEDAMKERSVKRTKARTQNVN